MAESKGEKGTFTPSFTASMYAKPPPLDEDTKRANREANELAYLRSGIAEAVPILRVLRDRIARSAEMSGRQKALVFALIDGLIDEGCA